MGVSQRTLEPVMTDSDKIVLARAIVEAGGMIMGTVPDVGGSRMKEVAPGDLPLFLQDQRIWVAKVCAVTIEDLDAYEIHERMPRCGAPTKAGHRCRNTLASDSDPATFARLHGGRCNVHS